ncbi:hypothetical protein TCAL_11292 [Tigriopus californicus]|uniref:GPR180/TMEM145 transmembrane domain-containing protein n=1 Tax=Tigriopus californicus TaxID=6832 RepID=A0A553P1L3_TIGCA|nr:hypothetical protein TCAL_11292 [Tigriopus californicus]
MFCRGLKWGIWTIVIHVLLIPPGQGLRVTGSFDSNDFFLFLAKFGFQKTELSDKNGTQGFLFGNVTIKGSSEPSNVHMTLAVLDRGYFLEYYGNRSLFSKDKACSKMFDKISTIAYDADCQDEGTQDFLRRIPCPKEGICPDEDNPGNLVEASQLTYHIQDSVQSRFWYVSLVACYRDKSTCSWKPVSQRIEVDYDLWLVNGNSDGSRHQNVFRYQYSYDEQDVYSFYLVLLLIYTILVPLQTYANTRQRHPITRLLSFGLTTEFVALLATNVHHSIFSSNGRGIPWLATIGEIGQIFSQVEVDVVEDIEQYQTAPGIIILILRIVVMVTFLVSLRDTMLHEHNVERLNFFLHFGAATLVWFIYLPLMAIVAMQISALWRTKFILGITYSADTFAYIVLIHLLWPSRKEQYFLLAAQDDSVDELEEFNEAPNILHDKLGTKQKAELRGSHRFSVPFHDNTPVITRQSHDDDSPQSSMSPFGELVSLD